MIDESTSIVFTDCDAMDSTGVLEDDPATVNADNPTLVSEEPEEVVEDLKRSTDASMNTSKLSTIEGSCQTTSISISTLEVTCQTDPTSPTVTLEVGIQTDAEQNPVAKDLAVDDTDLPNVEVQVASSRENELRKDLEQKDKVIAELREELNVAKQMLATFESTDLLFSDQSSDDATDFEALLFPASPPTASQLSTSKVTTTAKKRKPAKKKRSVKPEKVDDFEATEEMVINVVPPPPDKIHRMKRVRKPPTLTYKPDPIRSRSRRSSGSSKKTPKIEPLDFVMPAASQSSIKKRSGRGLPEDSSILEPGPFPCEDSNCDRSFVRELHRNRHMSVHKIDRQFVCLMDGCFARFARKDQRDIHVQEGRCDYYYMSPGTEVSAAAMSKVLSSQKVESESEPSTSQASNSQSSNVGSKKRRPSKSHDRTPNGGGDKKSSNSKRSRPKPSSSQRERERLAAKLFFEGRDEDEVLGLPMDVE